MDKETIKEMLDAIDPGRLDYQSWVNVGMALKHEGLSAYDWENWSARDAARYHPGECFKKWDSFTESTSKPVTGGTLWTMAIDNGWTPPTKDEGHELAWDDEVYSRDEHQVVDTRWIENKELTDPGEKWDQVGDLIKYIETLFQSEEYVGTVTHAYQNDEGSKWLPDKGDYSQTAGQILTKLKKSRDLGSVIGDPNEEAGAWIRFNPLDGKGCKNENVTDFRYALVESDTMDIERQNAIIRELELPVACLVHSGKKSIHAIVRIDAGTYEEYRSRVDFLYSICRKNGLQIDTQNRNPSRLSRMPGVLRNGRKQYLIDTNIGKRDWNEWREWIDAVNDDLPDAEALEDVWGDLPPLADPLIDGVLRQGHKLLLAGPSKAGKSFALIELCCAIAEGKDWLGWPCAQGRVLYVNLELDRASCLHRFRDVYQALGWKPSHVNNIDIWNLRGSSIPMDKLAPKLIRRANKKNYIAVILDPIYKVITGDENSADQMAHFCNQFDKVCSSLGCAVIYCHHHSKGAQGDKRAIDRASGSGVFARDPDALLDMSELELTASLLSDRRIEIEGKVASDYLDRVDPGWRIGCEDLDAYHIRERAHELLTFDQESELLEKFSEAWDKVQGQTPWRIEATLREFQGFEPKDFWFTYPIHVPDKLSILKKADVEGSTMSKEKKKQAAAKAAKQVRVDAYLEAFNSLDELGKDVTVKSMAEVLGVSPDTVKKNLAKMKDFQILKQTAPSGASLPSIVRRK